ncbi:substrate-binding domain-containing protein [Nocardia sp. ET3-3]|uniref:Substrate-binding domain-containing protein n=1 Tax=Nocardia terrae TaxID=2675851 RepID=A0A7K1V5J2_9NOCA|nr:sugar ABC transporter substrate-binding protein [Nocardia terrae]MVU81915.1 substrate-binding domain-containing protein [Nocardia terrae]
MRRSTRTVLAVIAAATTVTLSACGTEQSSSGPSANANGKPAVCLIMKSLANEYFQQMQKGAKDHADQLGNLDLKTAGIQNETDVDGQIALVDKCITQQVQAIVIAPADSKALVQSVVKASKAGIKVVNIDVALDPDALKSAGVDVPLVGPDNRAGAKQVGDVLAKSLGAGGKVVILEGNPGADNAKQRKNGFDDTVAESKLTLLDSKTAHWETDEAYTVFGNLLTAHPDLQGVMASNDSMALGVIKVIQERHANVKVVSVDNIPAAKPFLQSGPMLATLDQFGSEQAGDGIDVAMKLIGGQPVTGWQKTRMNVVTAGA